MPINSLVVFYRNPRITTISVEIISTNGPQQPNQTFLVIGSTAYNLFVVYPDEVLIANENKYIANCNRFTNYNQSLTGDVVSFDFTKDQITNNWRTNYGKFSNPLSNIFQEANDFACRNSTEWNIQVESDHLVDLVKFIFHFGELGLALQFKIIASSMSI
jgi:hypothetical protein